MKLVLQQSIRFILLMLLQIFIFSKLTLFNFGIAFIYIYFILFLPLTLKRWQILLIAFCTGLILDITTGTYGLHMAAATFIGFIKNNSLRLIVGEAFDDDVDRFSITDLKLGQFLVYISVMPFIFSIIFFALDYFSFHAIQKLLLQISISSVITFVLLFIYRFLFTRTA